MKLLSILSIVAIFCCAQLHAQFPVIANSPAFEEPESGFCKIILEKNGNTAFLHITGNEGIKVRIYDPGHKQIAVKSIHPSYGKLRMAEVMGAYEINQNIVLFIRELEDRKPILYRLIIDGNDGKLIEEKEIGSLKKMDIGKGYAMLFGKVPMPDFYVRKDPESDNYAVALFNSFASDRNERIELIHYNKDHQEISRAFYQSPNDEYKYLTFQDMCVRGDKEVIALAVGRNGRASDDDQNGALLMGSLAAGATSLSLNRLNYPDAKKIEGALIRYNKATDEYILLSVKPEKKSKGIYVAYKTIFKSADYNPVTTTVSAASLDKIANGHYDKEDQFLAIPQDLCINDDGSYTILFEENMMRSTTYNTGMPGSNNFGATSMRTSTKIFLNDIGIINYDKAGKEKGAFYIPKSQQVLAMPNMIYYSFRREAATPLVWGTQYKSFYYLNGKNQDYVFLNDIERNQEKINKKKKVTTIQDLNECEAYSFIIGNDGEMPKRKKIFNDKGKEEKDIALFTASTYDKENNVFATLKRKREGREKSVQVVWMTPN